MAAFEKLIDGKKYRFEPVFNVAQTQESYVITGPDASAHLLEIDENGNWKFNGEVPAGLKKIEDKLGFAIEAHDF